MSRTMLQIVNALLGILTILLAGMSLVFGTGSPIYGDIEVPDFPELDSNLRFMGGMGLGLGAILLYITPRIEQHGTLFRAVWICAFIGGIGRIISFYTSGYPPMPMVVFTIIEVVGVPFLLFWQKSVAKIGNR